MKRKQLFEFIDFEQTPDFVRDAITDYLYLIQKIIRMQKLISPKMVKVLDRSKQKVIYDLCSGGGGPMPLVLNEIRENYDKDISLVMTDLFPNEKAAAQFNQLENVSYDVNPVDATNMPDDFLGMRSMLLSFHHMPQDLAEKILADAFEKRQAICIFEITRNSFIAAGGMLFIPIIAMLLTPFTKPGLKELFFTYIIPINPIVFMWDGFASCFRTYSKEEMKEMTSQLQSDDYQWEIGDLRHPLLPYRLPYLIGSPCK
jgi:hypothetical protein